MTWNVSRALHLRAALVVSVSAIVLAPLGAWAQQAPPDLSNLSLEDLMQVRVEVVFGAAKRLQPATEAPSSVSIITADDIARHGYRSLAEILRGVRGLYVTNDRNYSYLGARGFARPGDYNTRVLLLVDGHRLNDDVFDQAGIGPELGLDPANFERVEIIRGPASALYGTSAFFAVVSITTRTGSSVNGVSGGAEMGTFGAMRAYGTGGRRFGNGLDLAVSANVEQIDGPRRLYYAEFDSPETHDGIASGIDTEEISGVTGRLTFHDLTVTTAYGWRRKVVPTAAFETLFNDPRFVVTDKRGFVDADYERTWQGTKFSIRGSMDRYDYDGVYPYEALEADRPATIFTDYGRGRWWGAEGRVTREVPGRQTLVGGLEFRNYVTQDQGAVYDDGRIPSFATDVASHVFAGYLQDEIRVLDHLLVSVGGRYDAYSGFDRVSPRASLVFAPAPNRSFKFLVGTAFRAPNAYELDYLTDGVRNTTLGAETIQTTEVAWEEYRGGWLRTSVSAYRNSADHLLTLVSDEEDVLRYENAGRVRATGLEFEAEMKSSRGVQALGSYSWQQARDREADAELTNAPRHLTKFRVSAPGISRRSTAALEVLGMSSRLTLAGGVASGHTIVNFNYVQPIGSGVKLTATARNLFDADYGDPASEEHLQEVIPQDGRTIRVGLQWSWTRR